MVSVLDTCLRLLHPFIPYVTEELWGHLKHACQHHPAGYGPKSGWEEALIIARWPQPIPWSEDDEQAIERFALIMDLVRSIRNLRVEKDVEPARRIAAIINGGDLTELISSQHQAIAVLAGLDPKQLQVHKSLETPPSDSVPLVVGPIEVYLPLVQMFDIDVERVRLTKELEAVEVQIKRLEALLAGPFSERAPADVVQKERMKLSLLKETAKKLAGQLDVIG